MKIIILGTVIVVIGAGIYYVVKKIGPKSPDPDILRVNEISMTTLGRWLKTLNLDYDDFGKTVRIFVIKDLLEKGNHELKLSKEVFNNLKQETNATILAFVLTDMDLKENISCIVIAEKIDKGFESLLQTEVTEINFKG